MNGKDLPFKLRRYILHGIYLFSIMARDSFGNLKFLRAGKVKDGGRMREVCVNIIMGYMAV